MATVFRLARCAGFAIAVCVSASERAGAEGCAVDDPWYVECISGQTTYHVRLPPISNPSQPIPTVVILHDAGGTGAELLDDPRLTEAFLDRGFALLAPDALPRENVRVTIFGSKNESLLAGSGFSRVRGTYSDKKFPMLDKNGKLRTLDYGDDTGWYYFNIDRVEYTQRSLGESSPGSRYQGRDEIKMLRDVLALASNKFRTETTPQLIIGLGHGGSLVWQVACYAPDLARFFAPVDGAFWDEVPRRCRPGAKLVHTHNRNSSFWPLDGADGGGRYYDRTSIYRNIEMMLKTNVCELQKRVGDFAGGEAKHTVWPYCHMGGSVELITMDNAFRFQSWWLEEMIGRLEQPDLEGEPISLGPKFAKPSGKTNFAETGRTGGPRFKRPK